MNTDLFNRVDSFDGLDVLVIGEAILDSYLRGHTDRLCEEAPVPVVSDIERWDVPGGAANTAVNIQSLGGNAHFLSVIGDDAEGQRLKTVLKNSGISSMELLTAEGRETLAKHRVIGSVQMLVRFDQGTTTTLAGEDEQFLIERLKKRFRQADAVVISDYGYGTCTPQLVQTLTQLQAEAPRVLVVDSKNLSKYQQVGVTAVKPNYREAASLLGLPRKSDLQGRIEQISAQGDRVLEMTGARIAAVTLDQDGALIFERGRPLYRTYAPSVSQVHAAGAGDTFVAALTLAITNGRDVPEAAELASAASAVAVTKKGTAACSSDDLKGYLFSDQKRIDSRSRLEALVNYYQGRGQQIVFTNGCFDILHRGHITYLSRAKALGDVLVVGLNSDKSIRQLKGPERPINRWEDRAQVLAALSCVDHVVGFDETRPDNLIRKVRPDVFVKGGDYSREMLPEAPLVEELGGTVQILPYVEDYSTTGLVEQIRGWENKPPTAVNNGTAENV